MSDPAQLISFAVLQVTSSLRDNTRDIKRTLSNSIFLGSASAASTPAIDAGDVVASISASPGTMCFPRHAVLRETTEKKRFVELWMGNALEVSKEVSDSHDSFYSEGTFSSILAND